MLFPNLLQIYTAIIFLFYFFVCWHTFVLLLLPLSIVIITFIITSFPFSVQYFCIHFFLLPHILFIILFFYLFLFTSILLFAPSIQSHTISHYSLFSSCISISIFFYKLSHLFYTFLFLLILSPFPLHIFSYSLPFLVSLYSICSALFILIKTTLLLSVLHAAS